MNNKQIEQRIELFESMDVKQLVEQHEQTRPLRPSPWLSRLIQFFIFFGA